jgi:hypothetical protein
MRMTGTFYFANPVANWHRGPHNRRLRPLYLSLMRRHCRKFAQGICDIDCTLVPVTYK